MTPEKFEILFMGTPHFAVESLKKLIESNKKIVGVVTAPDKPAGRGSEVTESPVKQFALANNLKVLQPVNLKDAGFIKQITEINPSLIVVVAFRMLPKGLWQLPEFGTINLHASLLPQYRGAAPINWAIINGETKTGVTTFFIEENIDTGKILLQKEVPIEKNDNAKTLHDKLMCEGANLLNDTITGLMNNELTAVDQLALLQPDTVLNSAPKIYRETCRIDWSKSLNYIQNFIRGLSPTPAAWTELISDENIISPVKIFESEVEFTTGSFSAGKIIRDGKTYLKIAHSDGYLRVLSIQIPGKRQLTVSEFLKGFRLKENCYFR